MGLVEIARVVSCRRLVMVDCIANFLAHFNCTIASVHTPMATGIKPIDIKAAVDMTVRDYFVTSAGIEPARTIADSGQFTTALIPMFGLRSSVDYLCTVE